MIHSQAFASPVLPLGETTHPGGYDILGGIIPDEVGYLNFQTITYTSDGKFLNATYYLREPFTPTIVKPVSYMILVDADSDPKTGMGGIDYIYNKTWSQGKWIITYEQIISTGEHALLYESVDPYAKTDNPDNTINLSLDLKRIGSPDNYLVSFIAMGQVDNASDIRQASSNRVIIPTPQFSMDFSPSDISLNPGDTKITTLQIHTNSKLPYDLQQDLIFSTREGIEVKAVKDPPYTIQNGIASIPLKITVPANIEPNYYLDRVTIYAYFNLHEYFSASNINNDVIKKSLYSTEPVIQGIDLPITVVPKTPMDPSIIVAIIAASAAIGGVVVSALYNRSELKRAKKDTDAKIRPILARTVIGESAQKSSSGDKIHENIFNLTKNKVLFHFTNVGSLPALNIRKKGWIGIWDGIDFISKLSTENVLPNGEELPGMAQNEKYSIDMNWDTTYYQEATKSYRCYFELSLSYEDPSGKPYSYHMEGHFDDGYLYLDYVSMT